MLDWLNTHSANHIHLANLPGLENLQLYDTCGHSKTGSLSIAGCDDRVWRNTKQMCWKTGYVASNCDDSIFCRWTSLGDRYGSLVLCFNHGSLWGWVELTLCLGMLWARVWLVTLLVKMGIYNNFNNQVLLWMSHRLHATYVQIYNFFLT